MKNQPRELKQNVYNIHTYATIEPSRLVTAVQILLCIDLSIVLLGMLVYAFIH